MSGVEHIFDAAPLETRVPVPDGEFWVAHCSCGWRAGRPSPRVEAARMLHACHVLQLDVDEDIKRLRGES